MREILSEASRLIRNRHFALAVLIMLIAFSGYAACDWVLMYNWDVAYRSSSLQQTLGGGAGQALHPAGEQNIQPQRLLLRGDGQMLPLHGPPPSCSAAAR